jgi:hypothetical protein
VSLAIRERAGAAERCPYCHDCLEGGEVEDARVVCEGCGTTHHQACLAELGGCTVMGCAGGAPSPLVGVEEVRARVRERVGRFVATHSTRPAPVKTRVVDFNRVARERLRERGVDPTKPRPRRRLIAAKEPELSLSNLSASDWVGVALLLTGVVVTWSFVFLG